MDIQIGDVWEADNDLELNIKIISKSNFYIMKTMFIFEFVNKKIPAVGYCDTEGRVYKSCLTLKMLIERDGKKVLQPNSWCTLEEWVKAGGHEKKFMSAWFDNHTQGKNTQSCTNHTDWSDSLLCCINSNNWFRIKLDAKGELPTVSPTASPTCEVLPEIPECLVCAGYNWAAWDLCGNLYLYVSKPEKFNERIWIPIDNCRRYYICKQLADKHNLGLPENIPWNESLINLKNEECHEIKENTGNKKSCII